MKPTRETILPGAGRSFVCLDIDQSEFDRHYHHHPEFEITWILESEGQRLIGDSVEGFGPGDLVLIGRWVPHQYRNWRRGKARARVIQFRSEMLGDDFLSLPEVSDLVPFLDGANRGWSFSTPVSKEAITLMQGIFEQKRGTARLLGLIELLSFLSADRNRKPIASVAYQGTANRQKVERLQRVLSYLEEHWNDTVKLDDVAQVAALHPQSLSRFFGQHLGMSFQEYLVQLRISRAARLLIETDRTVSDIALSCGFNNLSNFNAQFKRIKGQSPRGFRKQDSVLLSG
jgi:AraC-like DNA-binding protein